MIWTNSKTTKRRNGESKAPYFIAVEKFGPHLGETWTDYIAWSGLTQLTELISLDIVLCPSVISELSAEDWQHNVQEDFLTEFFRDLDYLLGRLSPQPEANILAVILNPRSDARTMFVDNRFLFLGYDLVERSTGISALTNCGGFEQAFANEDLSNVGLLESYEIAQQVQHLLKKHYPDEHHADCDLWAIWKKIEDVESN